MSGIGLLIGAGKAIAGIGGESPTESSTEGSCAEIDPIDYTTSESLPYFYISDLVDVILKSIESRLAVSEEIIGDIDALGITDESGDAAEDIKQEELIKIRKFKKQFKSFRVLLGPLEIVDSKDASKTQFVTLGDIPISTRYFTQWLTKKMLQREEVVYPLTTFLNNFINELLRDFMNSDGCFNGQVKQRVRLFQSALTSYRNETDEEWDNVTQQILDKGTGSRLNISNADLPILNISGDRGVPDGGDAGFEREINYITYFAGRTQPTEEMRGIREDDESRGLFHYGIGRDSGIVKTIEFQKTSVPSLKMVRFEQHGYDGLQQLREQYDANIKTFANVNAFPGSYIFIEPRSFAPNAEVDLTRLGIGGYHMIIRSEHVLAPGLAESTITAKWVAEIDQTEVEVQSSTNGEIDAEPADTPKKCSLSTDRAAQAKE